MSTPYNIEANILSSLPSDSCNTLIPFLYTFTSYILYHNLLKFAKRHWEEKLCWFLSKRILALSPRPSPIVAPATFVDNHSQWVSLDMVGLLHWHAESCLLLQKTMFPNGNRGRGDCKTWEQALESSTKGGTGVISIGVYIDILHWTATSNPSPSLFERCQNYLLL